MKFSKIPSEITKLQIEQAVALAAAERARKRIEELRASLASSWPNYLDRCQSRKFTLYKRFPTSEELRAYYEYRRTEVFPLYEYGYFNIKELAAIIKMLYSLKNQKEFEIITYAGLNTMHTGPEEFDRELAFHTHFLIGEDKRISLFNGFGGKYMIDEADTHEIFDPHKRMDLHKVTRLTQKGNHQDYGLGLHFEDFDGHSADTIEYYDWVQHTSNMAGFSGRYNIFDKYHGTIFSRLADNPEKNIGAVLSFPLHNQDNFIAKTLVSIAIYKRNIGKTDLDNEDYRCIFYQLFGEDVDISRVVDDEIPSKLVRVRKIDIKY